MPGYSCGRASWSAFGGRKRRRTKRKKGGVAFGSGLTPMGFDHNLENTLDDKSPFEKTMKKSFKNPKTASNTIGAVSMAM